MVTVAPMSVFRFIPSSLTIPRGPTNTTTLFLDGRNGTSNFNVTLGLSLLDPTIGEIVGVSLPGWTMAKNLTIPSDAVWLTTLDTAGLSGPGTSSARIGTITRGDPVVPQLAMCPVEVTVPCLPLPGILSYPNDINGNEVLDFNGVPLRLSTVSMW